MPTKKVKQLITDPYIGALQDFDKRGIIWNSKVAGLRIRVGQHRISWSYFQQHRIHGKRSTTCRSLGHWPVVNADDARKAALVISGRIAAGRREPGLRTSVRFDAALDEYLKFLRAKSARKGKPARHALNVEKLRRQFLSPEFGRWPLAD